MQFSEYLEPVQRGDGTVWPADLGPVLMENYGDTGHWAIAWESGPDDWALRAFQGGVDPEVYQLALDELRSAQSRRPEIAVEQRAREIAANRAVQCPDGVFCEPYMSFVLMVYPAG